MFDMRWSTSPLGVVLTGRVLVCDQAWYPRSVHADPVVWTSDDTDDPSSSLVQSDRRTATRVPVHAHRRVTGTMSSR